MMSSCRGHAPGHSAPSRHLCPCWASCQPQCHFLQDLAAPHVALEHQPLALQPSAFQSSAWSLVSLHQSSEKVIKFARQGRKQLGLHTSFCVLLFGHSLFAYNVLKAWACLHMTHSIHTCQFAWQGGHDCRHETKKDQLQLMDTSIPSIYTRRWDLQRQNREMVSARGKG